MENNNQDQSFDKFADKFEKNIYGSTKGRLRHELLVHHLHDCISLQTLPLDVLDAGGGTGVMSEMMINLGHKVTLSDISSDVLSLAKKKLGENINLDIQHRDILSLSNNRQYDLVVCHAVLEWLQHPSEVIRKLVDLVKPGGHLSLSFFNHDAQLFGNMLYGNFDYVEQGMTSKNIVRLSPKNPQKPKVIISQLESLPVKVIKQAGIRCFHDYLKQPEKQISEYEQLKHLEIQYGSSEPYLWLGKYFLIIAQKDS
ncbi:methyltransferase [Paraglaciecola psychrophila]|uniref:tRNA 5-carboxymethoxyuridine methyltransferase n=1 Tax=Paraglaciecola psychrophila 170 TaxID=1129794 RepID=K6ZJZ9_9ALTE|nr:methyltransferase [Paraglaciecola psychrophila]AGH44933.1 type 11 methyltransferase [Paraglaciecola psychrophila 170]GAC36286.1 S-adenosylmethionine-dependent methyltransferase [Paraglaciecola psychrophila 170]